MSANIFDKMGCLTVALIFGYLGFLTFGVVKKFRVNFRRKFYWKWAGNGQEMAVSENVYHVS